MVLNLIGVYIINRTLHGRLEIRNFSSRVEKIFHSFAALAREIFFNVVSPRGLVISSIYVIVIVLFEVEDKQDMVNLFISFSFVNKQLLLKHYSLCEQQRQRDCTV